MNDFPSLVVFVSSILVSIFSFVSFTACSTFGFVSSIFSDIFWACISPCSLSVCVNDFSLLFSSILASTFSFTWETTSFASSLIFSAMFTFSSSGSGFSTTSSTVSLSSWGAARVSIFCFCFSISFSTFSFSSASFSASSFAFAWAAAAAFASSFFLFSSFFLIIISEIPGATRLLSCIFAFWTRYDVLVLYAFFSFSIISIFISLSWDFGFTCALCKFCTDLGFFPEILCGFWFSGFASLKLALFSLIFIPFHIFSI